MKKGEVTLMTKALIGLIIGISLSLIAFFIFNSLLGILVPGNDAERSFEELIGKIDNLEVNGVDDLVYFIDEGHILAAFPKDEDKIEGSAWDFALSIQSPYRTFILNKPLTKEECQDSSCICFCRDNDENSCRGPGVMCQEIDSDNINGVALFIEDGSLKKLESNNLYIKGRNKLLLNLRRDENTLFISAPE